MRQVASVVKDGKVRYFIADTAEGSLAEFATVAVPDNFGAEQSVQLGFNLIAAVGLNGTTARRPSARVDRSLADAHEELALLEGRDPNEDQPTWQGVDTVVRYVSAHPGCRGRDLIAAFADVNDHTVRSATDRARKQGKIVVVAGQIYLPEASRRARRGPVEHRDWSHITIDMVTDYIRAHPGCYVADISMALIGDADKASKQTIGNRLIGIRERHKRGEGPDVVSEKVPNPRGGMPIVKLTLVE